MCQADLFSEVMVVVQNQEARPNKRAGLRRILVGTFPQASLQTVSTNFDVLLTLNKYSGRTARLGRCAACGRKIDNTYSRDSHPLELTRPYSSEKTAVFPIAFYLRDTIQIYVRLPMHIPAKIIESTQSDREPSLRLEEFLRSSESVLHL